MSDLVRQVRCPMQTWFLCCSIMEMTTAKLDYPLRDRFPFLSRQERDPDFRGKRVCGWLLVAIRSTKTIKDVIILNRARFVQYFQRVIKSTDKTTNKYLYEVGYSKVTLEMKIGAISSSLRSWLFLFLHSV